MSYYNGYNGYNPYGNYNPYGAQATYQPSQQLIKVNGLDGAKAYAMQANSSVALFHESENLMYIKTTDGAGFPTIRAFKFEEVSGNDHNVTDMTDYVTKDEFYKAIKELMNGEHVVSATE